jgi:hypothetical protein
LGITLAFALVGAAAGMRPLGLAWDLICFLPRAAHPFSPPCYAERAVPELARRVQDWIKADNRKVVLSAHSLGAVLAVAVIYTLNEQQRNQIRLLTYGVQLRPYFGRLFPDLLGPRLLGTVPSRGAALWRSNPWERDETLPNPQPETSATDLSSWILREMLPRRWKNLWRRTDYLGFPAFSYPQLENDVRGNDVDAPAAERVEGVVQTHGQYPRTDAYMEQLEMFASPDARAAREGSGQGAAGRAE